MNRRLYVTWLNLSGLPRCAFLRVREMLKLISQGCKILSASRVL
jgi:hypothetical protein